ncbi:MAG: bifunctional (p)ppGpp synthetase/guanosine-3',5'-bis(diphosphate) 3'-pyrophosphohydrolase [Chloroflexi bacterium]|nr:bifunctional (p)ppGpp synthetase/guanosine-3',5'-bis(diphosphate) 3'-pyrophosphohydrolase [Chloroflexota bacterium]
MSPSVAIPKIDELLTKIRSYVPADGLKVVQQAYDMAALAHAEQKRASGEDYVEHCLATADILADLRLDPPALAAGLLHDVVEDSGITLQDLQDQFGPEVAWLVDGVTKLGRLEGTSLDRVEAESLRKMFLAMAEDVRVVLIKLADRLHNMRTLWALKPERQRRMSQETLEIFAPLANRLGIWEIKSELEDLSLRYLEPEIYREIAGSLAERKAKREEYIQRVINVLREKLNELEIRADISGRPKHFYSIYKKMERKGVGIEQIYDLQAVRIMVETLQDCYAALGAVHALWRPIPGEFDDYIAMPKENLYRSLHTAVIAIDGKPLEVQIRTKEMHQIAEYGIAAHWRYKEQGKRDVSLENKIAWLRQLMEWRTEMVDPQDFVESLKTDVFRDQVYVFTPMGEIIDLPAGATPVDFAYRIHSEVGDRCRGAKVNGRLVSLDTVLQNGDQVEILRAKRGGPSRDWLNPEIGYVVTARAREKIRAYFRRQDRDINTNTGKEILERELKRLGVEQQVTFEQVAKLFRHDKVEDFLAAIGYGDYSAQQVATKILDAERKVEDERHREDITRQLSRPKALDIQPVLKVKGVSNLMTRLANCCSPLPGDPIVGYVTRGAGVTIHRKDCPNILNQKNSDRLVEVDWSDVSQLVYPVSIEVVAFDRAGLVHDISGVVSAEGVNMTQANVETNKKDGKARFIAVLEISSAEQLFRILNRLDRLPNVMEAKRRPLVSA